MKHFSIVLMVVFLFLASCGDESNYQERDSDENCIERSDNADVDLNNDNDSNVSDFSNIEDDEDLGPDLNGVPDDNNSNIEEWTRIWGSYDKDSGESVSLDNEGNIYVAGATEGSLANKNDGGNDAYLTKWDKYGTEVWTKQWGTDEEDFSLSVVADGGGNVIVSGVENKNEVFFRVFDKDGYRIWEEQWGSVNSAYISLDKENNIFIAGHTFAHLDGENAGVGDIYLSKWNSDYSKSWTKQWGTEKNEICKDIKIDANGSIFIVGYTGGSLYNDNAGGYDNFLTKLNSIGEKEWTKQWGTGYSDYGRSVSIDNVGNIYVAGYTEKQIGEDANLIKADVFLTKFNQAGDIIWTKEWGTDENDSIESVVTDKNGNIFVGGNTMGEIDGNENIGGLDIFLTKLNSDGSKVWTKQWGSNDTDWLKSLCLDGSDYILITGLTLGNLNKTINSGGIDSFLIRTAIDF